MAELQLRSNNSGSVAVIFALLLLVIGGAAGLAMDYTRAQHLKTRLQQSIDAAVLAAAQVDEMDRLRETKQVFKANLGEISGSIEEPTLRQGANDQLIGTINGRVKTTFSVLFGHQWLAVSARAEAGIGTSGGPCILVLDPAQSQSLLLNNGADVVAPNCEAHVKSTASPAAIFNSGTTLETARICIQSNNVIDNGGSHPNTELGCKTADDPFAGMLTHPVVSGCDVSNANYNGGTVNLNPGTYCGWINFNAAPDVRLRPGIYVIKDGGWNVNGGTWEGDGVVFYFADTSKIQFNSAVKASLKAPTSGPYEGIVMFEKEGLPKSHLVFDDSRGFVMEGLVYVPSRDTIFNFGTAVDSRTMTLVVNTLILNQTRWRLQSAPFGPGASGRSKSVFLSN